MNNGQPQIIISQPINTNADSLRTGRVIGIIWFIVLGLFLSVIIKKFIGKKVNFLLLFLISLIMIETILFLTKNGLFHWWSVGKILIPFGLDVI